MLLFTVIGNLGADARVETANGRSFISFSVAHSESYLDSHGNKVETTQWVSCALNGQYERLLPFLVKGRSVYVIGHGSARCFSSPKERRFVAGLNINVLRLELIGSAADALPRMLHTADGVVVNLERVSRVPHDILGSLDFGQGSERCLYGDNLQPYLVDDFGVVSSRPLTDGQKALSTIHNDNSSENHNEDVIF